MYFRDGQGKNYLLVLKELPVDEIEYTLRPDNWYEERHEGWLYIKERLKNSIRQEGLRYPLCIRFCDGKYICSHGGQRLAALRDLDIDHVSCVVCYKQQDEDLIVTGQVLDEKTLFEVNHFDIEKIYLAGNDFHVLVKDRKDWDPNDYERPDSRIH